VLGVIEVLGFIPDASARGLSWGRKGVIDPPLTTVSQPMHEIGSRATHRLMARIASPGLAPRVEILPTQVVIRTSCGCPPREA
jgi:LacI family transcriptional regulator